MGIYGSANFNEADIFKWLQFVYKTYTLEGQEVFGVFLKGSQNYGFDTKKSDIDCVCVIIPKFDELLKRTRTSGTESLDNSENQIDVKDIRVFFEVLEKSHPAYMELLFTDYFVINPDYVDLWGKLVEFREDIAFASPWTMLMAIKGNCERKQKEAFACNAGTKREPEIQEYGYSSKHLFHLRRLAELAQVYESGYKEHLGMLNPSSPGKIFKNALVTHFYCDLKQSKEPGYYSSETARAQAEQEMENIKEMISRFEAEFPDYKNEGNKKVFAFLEEIQFEAIRRAVGEEFKNG